MWVPQTCLPSLFPISCRVLLTISSHRCFPSSHFTRVLYASSPPPLSFSGSVPIPSYLPCTVSLRPSTSIMPPCPSLFHSHIATPSSYFTCTVSSPGVRFPKFSQTTTATTTPTTTPSCTPHSTPPSHLGCIMYRAPASIPHPAKASGTVSLSPPTITRPRQAEWSAAPSSMKARDNASLHSVENYTAE